MDSRNVEVCWIIEELELGFATFPKTSMVMDVMVANVPEAWGILLLYEWAAMVGGSIEMDISYVVITLCNPQQVRLYKEQFKLYLHGMNCYDSDL